jgi:SAM-dependent methyltransferase
MLADPAADTIAYYDSHAEEFAAQAANLDMYHLYDRFLRHVRPGGRILDAGCGVGRDTLAFAERGYEAAFTYRAFRPCSSMASPSFPARSARS